MNIENLNTKKLKTKLNDAHILIITPQIFLNLLRIGVINIHYFSLIVYDECHHCIKKLVKKLKKLMNISEINKIIKT